MMTPKKRPFTAHTNALMTLQNPFFGEMEGWNANVRICVVGLGYIGLPTASLLAKAGHEVIGVDINDKLIERLRVGEIPIKVDDDVSELARFVLDSGALSVSTTPVEADAFIVCVPTPLRPAASETRVQEGRGLGTSMGTSSGNVAVATEICRTVDLAYVQSAVRAIAPVVRSGNLVILESTVPPGTTEHVLMPIFEEHGWNRTEILLAHAPERVIPGAILRELVENDRVVGGLTPEATEAAKHLYATIVKGQIFTTDATTAEFVKLIENTYRDVNIALANELALVAEHLGINVHESIAMANRHPRVHILNPGPGVGGHCIPVDPYFLIEQAPQLTPLIQAARAVNNGMVEHVVGIVEDLSREGNLSRWVVLGVAYKADVGDERNSPALQIAHRLMERGLSITIHDPFIERFNRPLESAIRGAEALLLVTDHSMYRELDPSVVGQWMERRVVVDTRLTLDVEKWRAEGFLVRRLGDGRTIRSGSCCPTG